MISLENDRPGLLPRRFRFGAETLILVADEVTVGRSGAAEVDLTMMGRLRSRHARISAVVADRHRLIPEIGAATWINGNPVRNPEIKVLNDGDLIQFDELGRCQLQYFRPVAGSGTATVEAVDPRGEPIRLPNSWTFRRAVLLADQVIVRKSMPAHIVWPDLPCEQLCLHRDHQRLVAQASNALLWLKSREAQEHGEPREAEDCCNESLSIRFPCDLVVDPEIDEGVWIVELFTGRRPPQSKTIPIDPV